MNIIENKTLYSQPTFLHILHHLILHPEGKIFYCNFFRYQQH
jgi:hypothetical protein